MLGAICGDFIGSVFEWNNWKGKDFELFCPRSRFTDDTVMTIATIDAIINRIEFGQAYRKWYRLYPEAGYGRSFGEWASADDSLPYNSWGNGSAMRVSPVAYSCATLKEVLVTARRTALVSHNHPEGIKGAQAAAGAAYMARRGQSRQAIKSWVEREFQYNLDFTLDEIRPAYQFDVSCQGSVPQAIVAFLESTDYEDAVRGAISIGGDSDTIAAVAGGIAEAFYGGVPGAIAGRVWKGLPEEFRELISVFYDRYGLQLPEL